MCLGIPGQVIEFVDGRRQLAKVDVAGSRRTVNTDLVAEEGLRLGDWVLIHMGFAMEIIDKERADQALEGLRLMGSGLPEDPAGA